MSLQIDSKARILTDVPLRNHCTFKIGGPARFFSEPCHLDELRRALAFRASENLPLLIVGRASNVVFSDEGFFGLVLSLRNFQTRLLEEPKPGFLRAGGGVSLLQLALGAKEFGLGGLEFVCHIPGTVGGGIRMNAGFGRPGSAYRELKDAVDTVTVINLKGEVITLHRSEIKFEYRHAYLPGGTIVTEATFCAVKKPRPQIEEEIKANFTYRNSVQDLRYPSAGSVFKNPQGSELTSGQLLERAGLKKTRIGDAMVSERHANYFINVGKARATDVKALVALAQKRVFERFGIWLEPEIKIISEHDGIINS